MFVKGKQIPHPHSAIRLFSLLGHMKWAHLPVAGGVYDQHPGFIEKMAYIFAELDKVQEQEKQKADREREKKGRGNLRGRASRGRF